MADQKFSDFNIKASIVAGDSIPILDSEEALSENQNKRVFSSTLGTNPATIAAWSPTISTPAVTLTNSEGVYCKQGRLVTLQFNMKWPITSDSGIPAINNVPVNGLNETSGGSDSWYVGSVIIFGGSSSEVVTCHMRANTNIIYFSNNDPSSNTFMSNAELSDKQVIGTFNYISAS